MNRLLPHAAGVNMRLQHAFCPLNGEPKKKAASTTSVQEQHQFQKPSKPSLKSTRQASTSGQPTNVQQCNVQTVLAISIAVEHFTISEILQTAQLFPQLFIEPSAP